MLLTEQEMLRIDCHQARAANYNHSGVLSVSSLLTMETGLYGGSAAVMRDANTTATSATSTASDCTATAASDDRDVTSQCSARHFIAWSQKVTEKLEPLKVCFRFDGSVSMSFCASVILSGSYCFLTLHFMQCLRCSRNGTVVPKI